MIYHDVPRGGHDHVGFYRCTYIPPQGHIKIKHVDWKAIWAMGASTPEEDRRARMKQEAYYHEHDKRMASGHISEERRQLNERIDKWMRGGVA